MKKIIYFSFCLLTAFTTAQQESFTLQEAIDHAIANNVNVKSADLDVEIAKQQVRETISQGLPQINGNLNYDYYIKQPLSILPDFITPSIINANQGLGLITEEEAQAAYQNMVGAPQALVFGTSNNFSAGITWDQLLFSGSYLVGLQSAKAFKQISELGREKTEDQIKEAVINAYAAVLVAQENQVVINKNLDVANRNLYEIQEIFKAGFAEEQSVDQLRYTQTQLQTSLNYARRQEQIAKDAFKYVIGLDQKNDVVLTTDIEEVMTEDLALSQEINIENLENHVDYRLAQNQVKTGELQVKYQKTFALPTLSAFLTHGYNESGNEFLFFTDDKTSFQNTLLGIRMNVPVFSGFARSARTQQAKLNLQKAQLALENTRQELIQKAESARLEYASAMDNLRTAEQLVELSQSIYDKEKIKFFEGLSTSTELATAENQLYQSENQYIQSILQVVAAKTSLNQALGNY